MDPNHNSVGNGPALNLPPQPSEAAPEAPAPARAESAPAPAPAPPPMSAAAASWLPPTVPVSAPAGSSNKAGSSTLVPAPQIADDGDLIEKEWVMKAKHIVEQTRQDPYKQTKELHKFRADYMKKRYNKVIEPVED